MPTTSVTGVLTGTCSKCSGTTTVTLPKLDTTNYNYTVVTAATCTANGTGRYTWKTTTYGTFTFDVTIPKTGHSYTYAVTTAPTTSAAGVLTGTCSKCSGKTTVTLPKLTTTDYNYSIVQAATCTTNGTGRYTWRTTTYGTFSFDVTIPKTGHSYTYTVTTAPTTSATGILTGTCSKCSGKTTVTLPKLNTTDYNYSVVTEATCTANGTGRYTWKTTTYGTFKFDVSIPKTDHSYTYAVTTAPTTSTTGEFTGTCSKCGGTTTVTLPKLNTTDYNYSVTKAATCTATGTGRYTWKTTTYGTFYFDVTIPKIAHSYTTTVTQPTCTVQGYTTHTCSVCGDSYVDSYVDALGHDYDLTGWQWTGYTAAKATFTCKNNSSHVQAVNATITNVRTEPTCETAGSVVYTAKVSFEGKDYTDTKTQTVSALGHNWNAPTYTWAADNSTVTATRTCKNDASHVETETVNTTSEVTTPATCTAKGKTTYTATFTNSAFATQTKTVENVPALGHNWNTPTYTWAADNSTVTATRTCKNDATHVETETVNTTSEVTTPATCTAKGKTTYTATFTNSAFSTQTKTVENVPVLGHTPAAAVKEKEIAATCTEAGGYDMVTTCAVCGTELKREHTDVPALGHDWGEWCPIPMNFCTDPRIEDRTCNRCGATESRTLPPDGHTPGEPVKENAIAPTCEAAGGYDMVVYCTACGAEISREHTDTPALGHNWNEPEYIWADNYSTVTATRTCKNDASHKETETVSTTSEVTKEATYDEEGEITYTANFENEAFATQIKAVATPKLEKPDDPTPGLPCDGGDNCPGNKFTDMPAKGNWAHDPIDWAIVYGVTGGIDATHFGPGKTCTRAQVVTFLWSAAGKPTVPNAENPFVDVKVGAWYYDAVLWACAHGVTGGIDATHFGPGKTCTRAQVVTFLYSFKGKPAASGVNNPFKDVSKGDWFYAAVLWAYAKGVTGGIDATHFGPSKNCTRAQVVTFLYRTDQLNQNSKTLASGSCGADGSNLTWKLLDTGELIISGQGKMQD